MKRGRLLPILFVGLLALGLLGSGAALIWVWSQTEARLVEAEKKVLLLCAWKGTDADPACPDPEECERLGEEILKLARPALGRDRLRARARFVRLRVYAHRIDLRRMKEEIEALMPEGDAGLFLAQFFVLRRACCLPDWEGRDSVQSRRIVALTQELQRQAKELERLERERSLPSSSSIEGDGGALWGQPVGLFFESAWLRETAPGDSSTRSLQLLDTVLRYAPGFAPGYFVRGLAYLDRHEGERALSDFREAARIEPSMPEAHRWAAVALEKLGRTEEAVGELDQALAQEPDYPEAREMRERLTRK